MSDALDTQRQHKEAMWLQAKEEIDGLRDNLGYGIEPGIKSIVIALRAYDISTVQSCEGHSVEGQGSSYPWVEVSAPAPLGWEQDKESEHAWREANTFLYKRILDLLSQFYAHRQVDYDIELTLKIVNKYGVFRIESVGAPVLRVLTRVEQLEKFSLYRNEVQDFAAFLEQIYFD
jgi:hypothetical protein